MALDGSLHLRLPNASPAPSINLPPDAAGMPGAVIPDSIFYQTIRAHLKSQCAIPPFRSGVRQGLHVVMIDGSRSTGGALTFNVPEIDPEVVSSHRPIQPAPPRSKGKKQSYWSSWLGPVPEAYKVEYTKLNTCIPQAPMAPMRLDATISPKTRTPKTTTAITPCIILNVWTF